MKTLSEIKDEVAKESEIFDLHGANKTFEDWEELVKYFSGRHPDFFEPLWEKVVIKYAKEAIFETISRFVKFDSENALNLINELK